MSSDIFKVAYRFRLPALKGASQRDALSFFTRIIGEPETVDEWDGEVHGFHYANLAYAKNPVLTFKEALRPVQVKDEWGLEVVLVAARTGHSTGTGIQANVEDGYGVDLAAIHKGLREVGLPDHLIMSGKLYAYSWYNGGDEPVSFD